MNTTTRRPHLAVLGFGFTASLVVYSKILGPYLTFEGETPVIEILTLFLLPIAASVIFLLIESLRASRTAEPLDPAANAALNRIVLCVLLFLIGVHSILLGVLLEAERVQPWASRGVVVLMGLTLIAVGNLLPQTRPNPALGFRTSRTLADRQLWVLTHRASGYIAVAVGITTVLSGLLGSGMQVAQWSFSSLIIGVIVLLACYWKFSRVSASARQL